MRFSPVFASPSRLLFISLNIYLTAYSWLQCCLPALFVTYVSALVRASACLNGAIMHLLLLLFQLLSK